VTQGGERERERDGGTLKRIIFSMYARETSNGQRTVMGGRWKPWMNRTQRERERDQMDE